MRITIKRTLLILVLTTVAVMYLVYRLDKASALAELAGGGSHIVTTMGTVEYRILGDTGPYMLYVSPSAYDSAPLLTKDYQVIIPSRPGYAGTDLALATTPQAQARLYAALLDALNIDKVIVQATSAGGPSALWFAALYPERTRALLALSPASQSFEATRLPGPLNTDFGFWLLFHVLELFGDEVLAQSLQLNSAQTSILIQYPERVNLMHEVVWSLWPLSARAAGTENDAEQFRTLDITFDRITAPVLILHGSADQSVPLQHSEALVQQLSKGELSVIDAGVHMMFLTHGEEITRAFTDFTSALVD